MRRFTKNSCLFDFAPELVKEWHPSANSSLTPRNVKIAYPRKVWWICAQSHEWQATIKSRLLGGKCPLCTGNGKPTVKPNDESEHSAGNGVFAKDRAALQTPNTALDSDASDDRLGHDFRKSRRFAIRATAVLEDPNSGHWFYADAKNFSAGGICFESEAPVVPGTRLIIKLDRPLFSSSRKNFNSTIRWCRKLDNDSEDKTFSAYAMGAVFV
jgi:hypothetical protein